MTHTIFFCLYLNAAQNFNTLSNLSLYICLYKPIILRVLGHVYINVNSYCFLGFLDKQKKGIVSIIYLYNLKKSFNNETVLAKTAAAL